MEQADCKSSGTRTMDFILKPQDGDPHKNITTISRHLGILFSQIVMDKYLSGKPVAKKP